MIVIMATVHMTESEVARDLHAVLAKVEQGVEVVIEREGQGPVAVMRSPHRSGPPLTEILSEARERGSKVTLDEGFGEDRHQEIHNTDRFCSMAGCFGRRYGGIHVRAM